MTVSMCMCEIH